MRVCVLALMRDDGNIRISVQWVGLSEQIEKIENQEDLTKRRLSLQSSALTRRFLSEGLVSKNWLEIKNFKLKL